jgi:hypothetical protein
MARSRLTVAAVAPVVALALAALWAGPAAAHDTTVLIKVTAQVPTGPGGPVRVSAVTSYPDGHRAGGLTVKAVATQGARRVATTLAAGSRRGDWTGSAKLGPGRWSVKVTAAGNATGSGSATVTVPAPAPSTTTSTTAAPATTTPADEAASGALPLDGPAGGGGMGTATMVALGVAALGTAFVAVRTLSRLRKQD